MASGPNVTFEYNDAKSDALSPAVAYHQATKHHFYAYARGPHQMDWATQPNPFRRYEGAPLIALDHVPPSSEPQSNAAFVVGRVLPQPFLRRQVSQLFLRLPFPRPPI